MHRFASSMLVAFAVSLGLILTGTAVFSAQESTPSPAAQDGLCVNGEGSNWMDATVQPSDQYDGNVLPVVTATSPGLRMLYLVNITLEPGRCFPYSALGNKKDGAIVIIVQEGSIDFQWEPLGSVVEAADPTVVRGDADGLAPAPAGGEAGEVLPGVVQSLTEGDWITLNQEVQFSYKNSSSADPAVIWKAVWAEDDPGGCSGGCK